MKLSARNVFKGTVASVKKGAVNTEVILNLGCCSIASTITNTSADSLGLAAGKEAFAMIKASSIIIGTDVDAAKVSARNVICGTVSKVIEGPVSAEVDLAVGGNYTLTAIITADSAKKLGLKEGGKACAIIKASSVIMGVD